MTGYAPTALILTGPTPADSGTTLSVHEDCGARFPATPFTGIVFPPQTVPDFGVDSEEIVVRSVDQDFMTFERGDVPVDIEAGMQLSALRTVEAIFDFEEYVTLAQEFPATDTQPALHIRTPGGEVGTYSTALEQAVSEGGSTYSLEFEANESGRWRYRFTSDQRVFPEEDFYVRYNEVY